MILFLADIHLGVKLSQDEFYKSLIVSLDMFKKEAIIRGEDCELIIVCGDLFDHMLNIDEMTFASAFITRLCFNGCGVNGNHCPVHVIEGTFSHDRNQFKIFESMVKHFKCGGISYFNQWTKVTLESGKKLLYLPQEYGNVDYTEAFNDQYDLIVGHGPMSSQTKNVVTSHGTEIMHSVETLGSISKLCVFGHYHEYTDFGNGVYYAGSMLRFRYGEDETKVITMCDNNFNIIAHKNPIAKEYKTIEIHDPEELRGALSEPIETPHRFVIHPHEMEDLQTYHAIMNTSKQNTNVKFKVVDMIVDEPVEEKPVEIVDNHIVEPIESLIEFIKTKYDIDASEDIHSYEAKIKREE